MVFTAEQTARNAEAIDFNKVGFCLQWCRQRAGIPAHWGTAALAALHAERMHHGDRDVPRGGFAFWTGGSEGSGHIAIGLGRGLVRSTDADGAGRVATRLLDFFDDWADLTYVGWADNVNGVTVPGVGDDVPLTEPEWDRLKGIAADASAAAIEAATPAIVKATVKAVLSAQVDDDPEMTVRRALRRGSETIDYDRLAKAIEAARPKFGNVTIEGGVG